MSAVHRGHAANIRVHDSSLDQGLLQETGRVKRQTHRLGGHRTLKDYQILRHIIR